MARERIKLWGHMISSRPLIAPPSSPLQGCATQDEHALERGFRNTVQWRGSQLDPKLLDRGFKEDKFIQLEESFRMPAKILSHIKESHILPTKDLPVPPKVEGLGVTRTTIYLSSTYNLKWLSEDVISDWLYNKIMLQGIHPGHSALLYNDHFSSTLFPASEGGLPA